MNDEKFESTLRTPDEVAKAGLLSKNVQVELRKAGKLKHYRVGRRVFYSEQHLKDYFTSCEQNSSAAAA